MNLAPPTGRAGQISAIGLVLVVVAGLWFAVAAPLWSGYADRADALAGQRALRAEMRRIAAQLPALEQQTRQDGQAAAPPGVCLTGATDAIAGAGLEERLQTLATEGGATLSSAAALDAQPDGPYRRIQLHVAVTATWPALIGLLRDITTGAPTMLVDDLALTGPQLLGQAGDAPLEASFTVIACRAAGAG